MANPEVPIPDVPSPEGPTPAVPTPEGTEKTRGRRKVQTGKVISHGREKTITVDVARLIKHPVYEKFLRRRTRLHAHDEQNEARTGDTVEIRETRPLSKQKRWRLVRVLVKGERD
jgi:small subunit ribosomal protein S17